MLTLTVEEKQFISRLQDRLERVEQRYQEELTDFLEPRLQLVAEEYLQSCCIPNIVRLRRRRTRSVCCAFRANWTL